MAKKAGLIKQATDLGLEVSEKNTIAELEAAIAAVPTTEAAESSKAPAEELKTAKAGKRSAKALKEAEEQAAKEERKQETEPEIVKSKPAPKTRSKLERRSKKYKESQTLVDADKEYKLGEALDVALKTATTKFDSTVELHIRLNVDPRQADQNIRQTVVLPAGTGKKVRVAVFAETELHAAAKKAGADIVGADEFLQQLDKEKLDFDILVATPSLMAKLGKYARLLGPKGLMPNPKSGTVTKDVAKAVEQAKAGRVEYRVDSTGIVHVGFGKVSFGTEKLGENASAIVASVKAAKPNSIKGSYVRSAFIATTMGPSIKLANTELS